MSNLVKQSQQVPDKTKFEGEVSLDVEFSGEILGVCIDSSGSMSTSFDEHAAVLGFDDPFKEVQVFHQGQDSFQTRSQAAQKAMNALHEKTDFSLCDLHVWSFSDMAEPVECAWDKKPVIHSAESGGTNFINPLLKALEHRCNRIILVSDGEANYPEHQIAICQKKEIPVDCIFIGQPGSSGESTLRKIAEATGGKFTTVNDADSLVESFKELETSERLGLTYQPEEEKDSVIKL